MPLGPGGLDSNGIWLYGEDDSEALASDLLNLGMQSVSDAIGGGLGAILQVVSTTKTDTFSTTSTSYTDVTGLSASITPQFTSSKILVLIKTLVGLNTTVTTGGPALQLLRDATAIGNTADGHIYQQPVGATRTLYEASFDVLDLPSTTSSITYQVQIKTSTGTAYVNRSDTESDASASSITLMEVAG
jgi:hypothetical protein